MDESVYLPASGDWYRELTTDRDRNMTLQCRSGDCLHMQISESHGIRHASVTRCCQADNMDTVHVLLLDARFVAPLTISAQHLDLYPFHNDANCPVTPPAFICVNLSSAGPPRTPVISDDEDATDLITVEPQ